MRRTEKIKKQDENLERNEKKRPQIK